MQHAFDVRWRARALDGDSAAVTALAEFALTPLYRFCFHRVGANHPMCEEGRDAFFAGERLNQPVPLRPRGGMPFKARTPIVNNRFRRRVFSGRSDIGFGLQIPTPAPKLGLTLAPGPSVASLGGILSFDAGDATPAPPSFLYAPTQAREDKAVFGDLMAMAPGMNTTQADIQSTLAAEALLRARDVPGAIDPRAKALIEAARRTPWRKVRVPARDGQSSFTVSYEGTGRFFFTRTLPSGLEERVICDGAKLWHLYPELWTGSERLATRFQHGALRAVIPWALRSAADLAHGADLRLVGERTVALVPRGASKTDEPLHTVRLVFAEDGRLAERRWLEGERILVRESYSAAGEVVVTDGAGEVTRRTKLTILGRSTPLARTLRPGAKIELLSFPLRGQAQGVWLRQSRHLRSPDNFFQRDNAQPWPLGVNTLALSANQSRSDPTELYPRSPLAESVWTQIRWQLGLTPHRELKHAQPHSFLQRLATLRHLVARWGYAGRNRADLRQITRDGSLDLALQFISEGAAPEQAWALLSMIRWKWSDPPQQLVRLADCYGAMSEAPAYRYAARYEQARLVLAAKQRERARRLFLALHAETLAKGHLPRIEHAFREALGGASAQPKAWRAFVHETALALIKADRRLDAAALAWQCHQIGDRDLAGEVMDVLLRHAPEGERLEFVRVGLTYLTYSGQPQRANALLQPILTTPEEVPHVDLWQQGATLALQCGQKARALRCLETSLELRFAALDDTVDLARVRRDYADLLNRYDQVADALETLEQPPPDDFVARIVQAADRWRVLDPEIQDVCSRTARILRRVGAGELAWGYLTSPLATRSGEAAPWLTLARAMRGEGRVSLASRAYSQAFEAEATNAQILQDHVQMLLENGLTQEAEPLLRKLARGTWQPRFAAQRRWAQDRLERVY